MDYDTLLRDYRPVHPLPHHLSVYVPSDSFGPEAELPELVVVAGPCIDTHEFYILENVPLRGLSEWHGGGKMIQDALPGLSAPEREFIKSGVRPGTFAGPG